MELKVPAESVGGCSERNQPGNGGAHEPPTRQQRRASALFTYDTLGPPSFHYPTVQYQLQQSILRV